MQRTTEPGFVMQPEAPPVVRLACKLRWNRGGFPMVGLIVNRYTVAMMVHWDNGRTVPHFEPKADCPGCRQHHRPRWQGYVGCVDKVTLQPFLAMITPNAVNSCPELDPKRMVDLRGRELLVRKASSDVAAPQVAQLSAGRTSSLVCPDALPIRRILEDMWRLQCGCLGEDMG